MSSNLKKIIYFQPQLDGTAEQIARRRSDIAMARPESGKANDERWTEMGRSHGYHVAARTELQAPWFPDSKLIDRAPNLLAVCSLGAGYDVIDVDACTKAGIIVCNQSGANKEAVAEHTMGFMLNLSKQIMKTDRLLRRKKNLDRFEHLGNDLFGKTVGIIGLGNIGSRVAELCAGLFKMSVLAYDPYLTASQIRTRGAVKVELQDLLAQADFVTMHCPRSDETLNLMSYKEFSCMKPSAYFVNTSRGGTYSESGLVEALKEKRLSGAAVDVFLDEPPPPDHPLMAFDNVILSPHSAGLTHEALANVALYAGEQWIDIFDGKEPPRLINRDAWPRYSERFESILGFRPAALK
jgi:D-3-phosphoglycerate dehydrogenase